MFSTRTSLAIARHRRQGAQLRSPPGAGTAADEMGKKLCYGISLRVARTIAPAGPGTTRAGTSHPSITRGNAWTLVPTGTCEDIDTPHGPGLA